jgi:hypothetical protein
VTFALLQQALDCRTPHVRHMKKKSIEQNQNGEQCPRLVDPCCSLDWQFIRIADNSSGSKPG